MRKLFQTLFLFFTVLSISAQDVIYTISGDYNGGKTPLDSIVVDNITNGTSISFRGLPEHDYYQINLTKNSFWGTVSAFDIEKPSIFKELINSPGLLSVLYGGNSHEIAKVSVLNINGQLLYRKNNLTLAPNQSLQVNVGAAGVYFVRIELPQQAKTFKIIGSSKQYGYDVKLSDGSDIKSNISATVKSATIIGKGDFTFEENDSIRIWAFRKDIYAWPKHQSIIKSDNLNFLFNNFYYPKKNEMAYADSIGELIQFKIDEDIFFYEKINGEFVFQGDIILTEKQITKEPLKGAWIGNNLGLPVILWPNRKIIYQISSDLENDERINQALTYWNINAPVKFQKRVNEEDYVEFEVGDNQYQGSSYLGKSPIGGRQKIKVGEKLGYGEIMHEMGHTAGLIHEHSRSDRNDYIKIHWRNLENKWYDINFLDANLRKFTFSKNVGPFDFNSLMLYDSYAFSKDTEELPTITKLDNSVFYVQRSVLSIWDIKTLNELYGDDILKKPLVNSSLKIDTINLTVTISGKIVDEGSSPLTRKIIAWKKLGESEYNYQQFDVSDERFSITIPKASCGEYLYLATATNFYGTSSSPIGSKEIIPTLSVIATEPSNNSVKLTSRIEYFSECVQKIELNIWECNNGIAPLDFFKEINPYKSVIIENVAITNENIVSGLNPNKTYIFKPRCWISDNIYYDYFNVEFTTLEDQGPVYGQLTDSRDGKTYKTVKIGEQEWMAENLAFLPSVSPSSQGSITDPRFYVYGYQGTNVEEAKVVENYSSYGVLYNFPAANQACPSDWHLPSDTDWSQLMNYLANNGYNFDGSIGGGATKIAKSLAANIHWNTSLSYGAIGNTLSSNNKSGFSALPGGNCRNLSLYGATLFHDLGNDGSYWSSSHYKWQLVFSNAEVLRRSGGALSTGYSVRCVKNKNVIDSFSDDFNRSEIGNNWIIRNGNWAIENNQLKHTGDGTFNSNYIILNRSIGFKNYVVECKVKWVGGGYFEDGIVIGDKNAETRWVSSDGFNNHYVDLSVIGYLSTWNNRISISHLKKNEDKCEWIDYSNNNIGMTIKANQWYTLKMEVIHQNENDYNVKLFVDEKLFVEKVLTFQGSEIGVGGWKGQYKQVVLFDDFSVKELN